MHQICICTKYFILDRMADIVTISVLEIFVRKVLVFVPSCFA